VLWVATVLILAAAAAAGAVYAARRRRLKNISAAKNVIPFQAKRGKPRAAGGRKCSLCGKKADRIAFYVDEQGRTIGVCGECRHIAERRDLLRL